MGFKAQKLYQQLVRDRAAYFLPKFASLSSMSGPRPGLLLLSHSRPAEYCRGLR